MGAADKDSFGGEAATLLNFKQDPFKNILCGISCEMMLGVIADCGKMECRLVQRISEKAFVHNIHANFFRCASERWDTIQMMDQQHFEQDGRPDPGVSVVCTIKAFCKTIIQAKSIAWSILRKR